MKKKTLGMAVVVLAILTLSLGFSLALKGAGNLPSPREIAVVRIEGQIGGGSGALSQDAFVDVQRTKETLDSLTEDPLVSAVVLDIDSPGGETAPTADIVYSIRDLRARKPVVSYVSSMGASGGYWIASSANRTVVAPLAVVGSIGVFSDFFDASALLAKVGVNYTTLKAGKYKDAGSFARPMTDEERAYVQGIIDKIHDEFVSSVSHDRNIPVETLMPLAQGQIFLGRDAVSLGLADRLGTKKDAIELAKELSGAGTYSVSELSTSGGWTDFLRQMGATAGQALGRGFSEAVLSFAAREQRIA